MKRIFFLGSLGILAVSGGAQAQQVNIPKFSPAAQQGQILFQDNCSRCHGDQALGTEFGPPLLHPFYRPGHHDDASLARAITNGVQPHHWSFGAMPAIDTIAPEDIPKLVIFIREFQRANGIK